MHALRALRCSDGIATEAIAANRRIQAFLLLPEAEESVPEPEPRAIIVSTACHNDVPGAIDELLCLRKRSCMHLLPLLVQHAPYLHSMTGFSLAHFTPLRLSPAA
jgi:hypothetical protein